MTTETMFKPAANIIPKHVVEVREAGCFLDHWQRFEGLNIQQAAIEYVKSRRVFPLGLPSVSAMQELLKPFEKPITVEVRFEGQTQPAWQLVVQPTVEYTVRGLRGPSTDD